MVQHSHNFHLNKTEQSAVIQGSLEVKLPTIWTDEKQSREEAERRERLEERRVRRQKMQMREMVGKSRNTVFPHSGGSKNRLAKAAGVEPAGQMRDEKVHAVVARSTFPSQNVQNPPLSDHFLKLQYRKSARRCGAKHMSNSKSTKPTIVGPLLEFSMSKKCTRLWREVHVQVKLYKTHAFSTTITTTLHYTPIRYTTTTTTTTTTPSLHSTTLHSTTLHCTQLHSITLHYTTLHYTTIHYTTLHYTPLHSTTLHYTPLQYITLHYITLNDTAPQIDR